MPKAGFWAVGGYEISFRRDGHWYADEERIENRRIELLFSRCIRPDLREGREGQWMVDVGVDRQPVRVEDTPLVVTSVDGDRDRGFTIRTNDGVEEPLDCSTLEVGDGEVLYCSVDRGERGRLRARFLRPAYYRLVRDIELQDDRPTLHAAGRTYPL